MAKVKHRKLVSKSTFRNLPGRDPFWLASNLTTAPLIKSGRAATAGAFATDTITQTAVANVSVAVVKVPKFLL
jgi:hypothetical protein